MNANDASSPNGSEAFRALRRASNATDSSFAATTAPNIRQTINDNQLDLTTTRSVVAGPDGTAGLIPGPGVLCFVSNSDLLGTVTSCLPPDWAASHGGFGFVGAIGDSTLIQGVVPDGVTSVQLEFPNAAPKSLPLNSDNAYSTIVTSQPSALSTYSGSNLMHRVPLDRPKLPPAP
jgi:hypothetical protein